MLEIIPAIDLMNGQAVRLQRGDFATETRVADDPVKVAEGFAAEGATFLHIVDLDGARTGDGTNFPVIRAIIERVPNLRVQVGGGIRTSERIEQILGIGAARVIVGTTAASGDPAVIAAMLEKYAQEIIVGADTKDGFVAVHGWESTSSETAVDFGKRMVALGAQRFLYTDVSRDGLLQGANSHGTAELAQAIGKPVLASGGVAGPDDIKVLAKLQPKGVEGVIIGKALYSGRLTVADALAIARVGGE